MAAKTTYRIVSACGFAAAAAFYFANYATDGGSLAVDCIAKTLPVLFLSVIAFAAGKGNSLLLPAALLLSAAGDLAGECGAFLWQVSAFAAAHILYAAYFLKRSAKPDALSTAAATAFVIAGISVWAYLFRRIPDTAEAVFCSAYILLIVTMGVSSALQQCRSKWWYTAAAAVFMFSEAGIAWSRFVTPIPHSSEIIMSTYFVAQFAFTYLYISDPSGVRCKARAHK